MSHHDKYQCSCFCGAVKFNLKGSPDVQGYCHCDDCRRWAAGQVNAFTLWNPDAVEVISGLDEIESFDKNSAQNKGEVLSNRKWCKVCGGHVFIHHPVMGLIDVPAVLIEGLDFKPSFHVYYQETVLPMKDGLPKFKDLPKEAGGSGVQIEE